MVILVPVIGSIRLLRKSIVGITGAGTPPRWKPFLLQLAEWTLAVILSRFTCGSVVRLPPHIHYAWLRHLPVILWRGTVHGQQGFQAA